jgi:protein O-mannosyl-transferase
MPMAEITEIAEKSTETRTALFDKLIAPALFILAAACYANTLLNGFVYDDKLQILENPYIKSWHFLPQLLQGNVWSFIGAAGSSNYYRPLMLITYLGLWQTFGDLPFGYHLLNIFLNCLIVVCVYLAGKGLLKDRFAAAAAAVVFALHPVHSETVNWIAAVPDLEATLLVLLAFLVYLGGPHLNWKKQTLMCAFFALAILAKEPALMFLPLIFLYDLLLKQEQREMTLSERVKSYLPVCTVAAVYLLIRIALLGKLAPVLQHAQVTWPEAFYSAFALIGQYAKLLVWPTKLSAFHVFHKSNALTESGPLLGLAIVAAGVIIFFVLRKPYPRIAFALAWIGITLFPVLNARWMASNVLAERYLYLPSVGFAWMVGWAASVAWSGLGATSPKRAVLRFGVCGAAVAFVMLSGISIFARTADWRDDFQLYSAALRTDPDSFVMRLNLGTVYFEKRDFAGAEQEFLRALELKPDSVNVMNALACLYIETKRYDESEAMFHKALALKPEWTDLHFNHGRLLTLQGKESEALAEFYKAVETAPVNPHAHFYLAEALAKAGKDTESEKEYKTSIALAPSFMAEHGLVALLLQESRQSEAEALLRQMSEKYPYDPETHMQLGQLLEKANNRAEALKQYKAVLVTDPEDPEAKAAIQRLQTP